MKRTELIEGDLEQAGQWRGAIRDGVRTANVSCPGCGRVASLSSHDIDSEGNVNPSVVCPFDCGFHDYVILVGWTSEVR